MRTRDGLIAGRFRAAIGDLMEIAPEVLTRFHLILVSYIDSGPVVETPKKSFAVHEIWSPVVCRGISTVSVERKIFPNFA